MADGYSNQGSSADMRTWEPQTRYYASMGVLMGAAALLLLGLIFYFAAPGSANLVMTIAVVGLILLALFEAAVITTGIATEDRVGPTWLQGPAPAGSAAQRQAPAEPSPEPEPREEVVEIDLKCPECAQLFTVEDTGERPLEISCPNCGAHGHVDVPEDAGQPQAPEPEPTYGGGQTTSLADEPLEDEPAPEHEVISLKCPACGTQFEVEDTGQRPLQATCPGCGKGGKLR